MKITKKRSQKKLQEKFSRDDFRDVYATAQMAHTGQKRRSGEDYFTHPSEVRNIVARFYPSDRVSQLAALLHDSLEDAPGMTVDSAEEMEEFIRGSIADPAGADEVIRVVRALTHEKGGDYLSYVVSLMNDEPSLRVKLADMVHNLSSSPSPKQKEKYKSALNALSKKSKGRPPLGISVDHWNKLFALTESNNNMKITKAQLRKIIREATDDLNVDAEDFGAFIGKGPEKDRPKHYVDFADTKRVEDNLEAAIREMIKITPVADVIETLLEIADEIKEGTFR